MNNQKYISFIIRNNEPKEATRQIEKYIKHLTMRFTLDILKELDEDPNDEMLEPKLDEFLKNVKLWDKNS